MRRRSSHSSRKLTVFAALAANVAIAIAKFIAAAVSGSSGLFSEALHSLVDTGDSLLILLGMRLSKKPATERHPYGRGAEVYFWSLVVAMSIFGMGGLVSIEQGVEHLRHPHLPEAMGWSYGVLGMAALFEGTSWLISLRGFRKERRADDGILTAIRRSKDPTTFIVVLEDSAALIGIVIAAIGITLARVFHQPAYDAMASLLIGGLLIVVGVILARETWSLLLGESASRDTVESIHAIARAHPGIRKVIAPRTMHLGPELVHVDLDLALHDPTQAIAVSREVEAQIHAKHPEVLRVGVRFPAEMKSILDPGDPLTDED